jgi:hypothetical protein
MIKPWQTWRKMRAPFAERLRATWSWRVQADRKELLSSTLERSRKATKPWQVQRR